MKQAQLWIGAAALAAVVVGCGSEGQNQPQGQRDDKGPTKLQPVAATPASGTHRVICRLQSDHGRVRLALDLPRGFSGGPPKPYDLGHGCSWHRPVQVPDDGNFDGDPSTADTYQSEVILSVRHVPKGRSMQDEYDAQKPDAVEGNTPEGDDSILHLTLTNNVKVFGETVGDRLSYLCFCDGQNTIHRNAQADGILLSWNSEQPLQKETDHQLEAVLASVGLAPRD